MNDITVRRPVRWCSEEQTDVGAVRKINEDSLISRPELGLWAIADGMGGYEAGDVASGMIVKSLANVEYSEHLDKMVSQIEDAILDVNTRIIEYADIMLEGRTLGSTVVTLLIKGQLGVCFWAGDSRLYRYRNQTLEPISRDHSRVEELLRRGALKPEDAIDHPESNVITRAVGVTGDFKLEMTVFPVCVGDTFLLCSDGLYNAIPDVQLIEVLTNDTPSQAIQRLIAQAIENKANDNVSAIVVKGMP
jgi:serine/threonine protein phosphatase PrpC